MCCQTNFLAVVQVLGECPPTLCSSGYHSPRSIWPPHCSSSCQFLGCCRTSQCGGCHSQKYHIENWQKVWYVTLYIGQVCVSRIFDHDHTDIADSNLMQAISSIVLLLRGQIILMQLTLIGNLLVNILLLPALSIFYATYQGKNMVHDHEVTKKYTLLLFLATSGFVAPTVFNRETTLPDASTAGLSRATSILLILTYAAYLVFQLWTHKNFFEGYLPGMHHPSTPISSSPELMIAELQTNSTPQRQENGE